MSSRIGGGSGHGDGEQARGGIIDVLRARFGPQRCQHRRVAARERGPLVSGRRGEVGEPREQHQRGSGRVDQARDSAAPA